MLIGALIVTLAGSRIGVNRALYVWGLLFLVTDRICQVDLE